MPHNAGKSPTRPKRSRKLGKPQGPGPGADSGAAQATEAANGGAILDPATEGASIGGREDPLPSHGLDFGVTKLILEYLEARPGLEVLQQRTDQYMQEYEAQQRKRREELEARAAAESAEEGWTLVLPRSSRELADPNEGSAAERGSLLPGPDGSLAAVPGSSAHPEQRRKKKGIVGVSEDFYKFQARDARWNELLNLREKFEEDKKRIAKLRESRKFKPY